MGTKQKYPFWFRATCFDNVQYEGVWMTTSTSADKIKEDVCAAFNTKKAKVTLRTPTQEELTGNLPRYGEI